MPTQSLPGQAAKLSGSSGSTRWRVIAVVAATVAVVAAASVWLQARRAPTIQWSTPSLTEFLVPSESRTINLTFRSKQRLDNISVSLTPSLTAVATVSPTSFSRINANETYQVALQLRAGVTSEVKFEGTMHLRSGSATQAQPLPAMVIVHSEPVPPDPGAAGDQTVLGIDSDRDGTRDDVQRLVVSTYLNSPRTLAAGMDYAKASQTFLRSPNNESMLALGRSIACARFIRPTDSRLILRGIEAQQLNTLQRTYAWQTSSSAVSGVYDVPTMDQWKVQCSFDPDLLRR
jgi:hypothetical protein